MRWVCLVLYGVLTLIVAPFAVIWLQALATERGWLTSPGAQVTAAFELAASLANNRAYLDGMLLLVGATFGSTVTWAAKHLQRKNIATRKLEIHPDAAEASGAVRMALEKIRIANDSSSDECYSDAIAAIASAAVSLRKIDIPILRLDHNNRGSYLLSQRAFLKALEPLVAAGHLEEAQAVSLALSERLSPLLLK